MQSRRSLSFLSVLLLVFTQLTSALPNPAPKELVVRAAEAKAAAVNIAVRDNSPPPSPGNGRSGNGNDWNDNGRMRKIDDVGENDDFNNNDNNPPLPPGRNNRCDENDFDCWRTVDWNRCDQTCWDINGSNFIIYIRAQILVEINYLIQSGSDIDYNTLSSHVNNIRGYIDQTRDRTSSYGNQWSQYNGGYIRNQIVDIVDGLNRMIDHLSSNVNSNVYGGALQPLCQDVGSWFSTANNAGFGISSTISSISQFTQLSASKFGVSISL